MEAVSTVCTGDYNILVNAVDRNDINTFRSALNSVSAAEKSKIFEYVCQTPDRAKFIKECISSGCDVNEPNAQHKRPINFVLESNSVENLEALLRNPTVDVNARSYMYKQTPVNALTEEITDKNFNSIFQCMKLLIEHGADLSVPDRHEVTPMTNILKNHRLSVTNKELIVRYFGLPNNIQINEQWDFIRLFFALTSKKEDEFLEGLSQAEKNPKLLPELFTASVGIETLLIVAVREDLILALEKMIQLGADVNQQTSSNLNVPSTANWMSHWTSPWLSPAICACIRGHWRSLETLLKSPKLDVNSAPLLQIILGNFGYKVTEKVDYEKCFELLVNHPKTDVNRQCEYSQNVLHHAAMFNNTKPILELLKRGAYIGGRNAFGEYSISHIGANVLETHFDSCIKTNGFRSSDDKFEIEFNFKNFIPYHNSQTDNIADEMGAIEYISKTNELKHLTMHPLIASYLSLKWNRLAPFFYINFFLCTLFAVTAVTYILQYYNYHKQNGLMRVFLFLLTAYIAAREVYQFTFSPIAYLKSLKNYLEFILVVLVVLILLDVCPEQNDVCSVWRRFFAATSILLVAIEIFLLAGSLPFWSFCTHYVILKTVIWSFLKSLLLYAIIPLAFSLSFFTLLHKPREESMEIAKRNTSNDGDFNKFPNIGLSIVKTLVMSTGEFDVDAIDFKSNTFNYVVFMIFVFIVTIVLFNLLNGLAVSDTQAIKSQAELTSFISCARILARYEGVLATRYPTFFKIFPFCAAIDTFKLPKSINRIRVTPNDSNKILIMPAEDISVSWWIHLTFFNRCTRMDSKIVKSAYDVLKKKRKEQNDEEEKEKFNQRITKMEITLEKIANRLMMPMDIERRYSQKLTKRVIKMETALKKIARRMSEDD